ncbi:hypothetical protein NIES2107_74850 (plasmid) [Nostoc carneum NIES-2107]|nr:hypothetical protein NIES2107_74850 [Nostoc carneum NIES-2107]
MNTPSFGCVPNYPDDRDYIIIDTLERLEQELTKLQQQGIKVGIWKPNRNRYGEPTNYKVDIRSVNLVKTHKFSTEDIIIPLKPSIRLEDGIKQIKIDLPACYSLYKGGYLQKALAFNGIDSYLEIPEKDRKTKKFSLEDINFRKEHDFTIALWVKANSQQVDVRENWNSILEKWEGNSKHSNQGYPYAVRYDNSTGKIVCSRFDGGHNEPQVISETAIDDGEFHHVAFVKKSDNLYLYIDGELEDRTLDTTQDNNSAEHCTRNRSSFYLGCLGKKTNYFKGQLSDIRIWEKSLTEEDIRKAKGDIPRQDIYKFDTVIDSNFNLSPSDWEDIINHTINDPNEYLIQKCLASEIGSKKIENFSQAITEKYVLDLEIINNYFDPEFKLMLDDFANSDDLTTSELSRQLQLSSGENRSQIEVPSKEIKTKAKLITEEIIKKILNIDITTCSNNLKLVNFENWSLVKNQGELASCTAHAAVALLEYFERKASGIYEDYSRFFLYQVAYQLSDEDKNKIIKEGISIRQVMAAMITFGVVPEKHWCYPQDRELTDDISKRTTVEKYPTTFVYTLAQKYKAKSYFCLNRPGMKNKLDVLDQIKVFIYAGFPPMFGFRFYQSAISESELHGGKIPFPNFITTHKHDDVNSNATYNNHALVAVGYDDNLEIETDFINQEGNQIGNCINKIRRKYGDKFIKIENNKLITTGAFRIRNSFGKDWGENGYGWLPYAYVLAEIEENGEEEEASPLTFDWWSMLKAEWFDTDYFGLSNRVQGLGNPNWNKRNPNLPPSTKK